MPAKLVLTLPQHEVYTFVGMQWVGIKNGELLKLIENQAFDVFVTGDKNMEDKQHLLGRPFAVLIISAINWPVVRQHIEVILVAIEAAVPSIVGSVDC